MNQILVKNLIKEYITHKRGSSFGEAVKSLFHRQKVIVRAVDNISFTINKGEIVGILGRNGAGKSTTIKMLTGVLTPTSGSINAFGYTPDRQRTQYVQHIGAVFGQKSQLIWDIPPMDSFQMNKAIYDIPKETFHQTLHRLVELLEAGDIINRPTRSLSLGERMKCEFIMAMLHSPSVVFLDEPTIGLDIIAKDNIRRFVRELNKSGTTFILTTHDLVDVEQLAHRVIIIDEGKKVFEDSLENLKHHLGNRKMVRLKSDPPARPEELTHEGVTAAQGEDGLELTVDCDQMPMKEFVSWLGTRCQVKDLAIEEIPMEAVVRSIYEHGQHNESSAQ